jgi:hypothetical protein
MIGSLLAKKLIDKMGGSGDEKKAGRVGPGGYAKGGKLEEKNPTPQHIDEPTTGKTAAQKKAESAAGMLPGPLGEAAKAPKKSADRVRDAEEKALGKKCGGAVKKMAKGGVTRADGCATKGKTKGRML